MADRKIILVISGEMCTGKSTLAEKLASRIGFKHCKTREGLYHLAKKELNGDTPERAFLQKYGERQDTEGGGRWVLDYFQDLYRADFTTENLYVVDSARIIEQVQHIRDAYSYFVHHIHLEADPETLKERFFERGEIKNLPTDERTEKYLRYKADKTEANVYTLGTEADLVINTDKCNDEDVYIRVASFLRLLPPTHNELVDVIIGGQFGSEGKGQIAAHIAPEYDCLMRVGGPNAGHTVFQKPNNHVFHLLPSGSYRAPNAKILIGPGAVLSLPKILEEIRVFEIEKERLIIDENAIIISQTDIDFETKVKDKISSTGQGVGAATASNIISRLLGESSHKAKNFKELLPYIGSTSRELENLYKQNKKILLEGTQGSGLSLHHGLYPHVTSRDTSVAGCLSEAGISARRVRKIIMVTRTYPIRVGGESGPFGSNEIDMNIIAQRSGKSAEELLRKEITTTTKKNRRIAEFSWDLFRRACELNSPTDIALTFTDYFSIANESSRRYENLTDETQRFIEEIECCSGVRVSLIGTTFDYRSVIDRRNWS
ncbi:MULTISPECIES: adenylosuccinate synthetase [Dyadobacter]|uniref:Adenylosuccinate synthetase n=1 Tax=Dyadobacter psychrotolerans TaxID=2541721 RepID=A0A4R5DM82_9BACT|nr:adenylosuccinate synthetase [Dyadobacter psychrotolerans]TDE13194.1 adenylosuccinate synthase [Dyadobacter psychrotolerans]